MKRLCSESESDNDGKHKDLLRDPLNGRKAILQELFGLPTDASRNSAAFPKSILVTTQEEMTFLKNKIHQKQFKKKFQEMKEVWLQ